MAALAFQVLLKALPYFEASMVSDRISLEVVSAWADLWVTSKVNTTGKGVFERPYLSDFP